MGHEAKGENRDVLFSRGLHLSKFLDGRLHDIHLHHVVLAAHFDYWGPIPTPRYFGLGQGNLDNILDLYSVFQCPCVCDHPRKGHSGAQYAAGSAVA